VPLPYVASRVYEREDDEASRGVVKAFKKYYVIHLEAKLKECVGSAHLELAKRYKAEGQSATDGDPLPKSAPAVPSANSGAQPGPAKAPAPDNSKVEMLLKRMESANDFSTFRTKEAALVLQVSAETVNRWARNEKLTRGSKRGTILISSIKRKRGTMAKPD
jgi:hypothetical protein